MLIRVKTDWARGNILGLLNRITGKACSTTDDIFTSDWVTIDIHGGTVVDRIRLRKCGYQIEKITDDSLKGRSLRVRAVIPRFMDAKRLMTAIQTAVRARDINIIEDRVSFEILNATEQGLEKLVSHGLNIEVIT